MQAQEILVSRVNSVCAGILPKALVASILAWPATVLAPMWGGLAALFALVVIDLLVGIWKALKQNNFSSARLRTGISKFILYPMAVIAVRITETLIPLKGTEITYVADFTILYLAITELISILETLTLLGVNIPSPVLQFFTKQADINKILNK